MDEIRMRKILPLQWLKPYAAPITGAEVREARSPSGLTYRAIDSGRGWKVFCGVEDIGKGEVWPHWEGAHEAAEADHAERISRCLSHSHEIVNSEDPHEVVKINDLPTEAIEAILDAIQKREDASNG